MICTCEITILLMYRYTPYIATFGPLDWPSTHFLFAQPGFSGARQFPDAALVLACGDLGGCMMIHIWRIIYRFIGDISIVSGIIIH